MSNTDTLIQTTVDEIKKSSSFKDIINASMGSVLTYKDMLLHRIQSTCSRLADIQIYKHLLNDFILSPLNALFNFLTETTNNPLFIYSLLVSTALITIIVVSYHLYITFIRKDATSNPVSKTSKIMRVLFWSNILTMIGSISSIVHKFANPTYELLGKYYTNYIVLAVSISYLGYFIYRVYKYESEYRIIISKSEFLLSPLKLTISMLILTLIYPIIFLLPGTITQVVVSIITIPTVFAGVFTLFNKRKA